MHSYFQKHLQYQETHPRLRRDNLSKRNLLSVNKNLSPLEAKILDKRAVFQSLLQCPSSDNAVPSVFSTLLRHHSLNIMSRAFSICFLALIPFMALPLQAQDEAWYGGLAIGEQAPPINGFDVKGNSIRWQNILAQGPVIVIFYHGSWCPYCNVYLAGIARKVDKIRNKATILAITPQKPGHIEETIKLRHITFPVIYDEAARITKSWRTISTEQAVREWQASQYDVQLLPVPATYVIDTNGRVTMRHFEEDARNRMDVELLVHEIKRLTKSKVPDQGRD